MSVINPVQSHDHEGCPMSKEVKLRWEGFVEKVGFQPGVKEWMSDGCWEWRWWQRWLTSDEEVNQDMTDYWRGWRNESRSWFQIRDAAYLNKRSVIFNEETVGGPERVTTDEERVLGRVEEEQCLWLCLEFLCIVSVLMYYSGPSVPGTSSSTTAKAEVC